MARTPGTLVQQPIASCTASARFPGTSALLSSAVLLGLAPATAAQTQFEERASDRYFPEVADTTKDLVAADFDGDGDPDVLTANKYQPERLYLNDGEGVFVDVTETNLPLVSTFGRSRIGIGDIDGDGDLDALAVTGTTPGLIDPLLLVNDGAGRFDDESAARLPVSSLRKAVEALFGDVDGDGDLDLVVPRSLDTVGLFLNDGLGSFTDVSVRQMPAISNLNLAAALADVDGDLDLDLFLANFGVNSTNRLYLNDGSGFFVDATATNLPVGSIDDESMAFVDVDLDLDLDVILGDISGTVTLLLNDGHGVFADASSNLPPVSGSERSSIAVGDLDGDLDPDIVLGEDGQSELLLGVGTGAFVKAPFPAFGLDFVGGIALADVDGDADLDLLMGRDGYERLYLNDGAGGFTVANSGPVPWGRVWTSPASVVALADLDLDGDQDIVTLDGAYLGGDTADLRMFFNDGIGAFPAEGHLLTKNGVALAAGDVDGDADPDLLIGTATFSSLGYGNFPSANELLFNDGQGRFSKVTGSLPPDWDDTFAVTLADVDGDADLDAVLGNWQQQSRLYQNAGNGLFTDVTAGRLPARADKTRALGVGDFDGDHDLDIVLGNDGQQSRMYVNEGRGAFFDGTATRMPPLVRATHALGVADLDGDGDLDLVLGNDGRPGLYLNNGLGKLLDYTDFMPQQTEVVWALEVGDVDDDGDIDVVLGNRSPFGQEGQNRLLLNDGAARFTNSDRLPADLDITAGLALGDIDGDRDPDLVAVNLKPTSFQSIGTNRVYSNLHRQLDSRLLPLLGRTYEIQLDSEPGYASEPHAAIVAFSGALLPAPIPVPRLVGELAIVPPFLYSTSTTIPSPLGSRVLELAVPMDPALVGMTFYAQAVILGGPANLTSYIQDTFGL